MRLTSARKIARARPGLKQKIKAKSEQRRGVRRRRTPEEARSEALASARALLLNDGPDAVTLQRVATDLGMTHSNLLHHFGTAGELQSGLMAMMVTELAEALEQTVVRLRSGEAAPRVLVDMVFDAFDEGGAGRLAAWIALTGHLKQLDSIEKAVQGLVKAIEEKFADRSGDRNQRVTSAILFLSLMAFGDAVIGASLKDILERERTAPRRIAAQILPKFFEA